MADEEQLAVLRQGADAWNAWREERRANFSGADLVEANFSGADLSGMILSEANLFGADLVEANLSGAMLSRARLLRSNLTAANLSGAILAMAKLAMANLPRANLSGADLVEADLAVANLIEGNLSGAALLRANLPGSTLWKANLVKANLSRADLSGADLSGADLSGAALSGADLSEANLSMANLVGTNFTGANLTGCRVYGISAWNLKLDLAIQDNLIITQPDEPEITVDNLEVAQFIYLLLHNERIRDVIDTITSKVVLILGRFTPERKAVLDALRHELRSHNLTPVLFDFDIPADRDITETVTLLARMAKFIVADLTDPASIPMELQAIAPDVAVPILSLVQKGQKPFSMFRTLKKYPWVLPPYQYSDMDELLANLQDEIIAPAEAKARDLRPPAG